MTVPERVREFVRFKKLSVAEFCRRLDVSSAYVSSMSKSMSLKIIQRISLVYPELNILWLQTGEGEMIKRPDEEPIINFDVAHCRECDRKEGKIELLLETVRDLQQQLNEMTALYRAAAAPHCGEKKKGEGGGGEVDDVSPSLRRHSMASLNQRKI